ncbi:MAG: response regulator transcription factor [Planctomycetaceae bacterium]
MGDDQKRILLVDDDPDVLTCIEIALKGKGYEVILARDGAEGLARAERDAPDLIILDLVMPQRSGFAVLSRLRCNVARSPRIILLTANNEPRFREFAESNGADVFLSKPFEVSALIDEVEALLESC